MSVVVARGRECGGRGRLLRDVLVGVVAHDFAPLTYSSTINTTPVNNDNDDSDTIPTS